MGTLRKMWVVLFCVGLLAGIAQVGQAAQTEELNLPEDTTTRLIVSELRIRGNTLITTSELLEYMPEIYNASDQRLSSAPAEYLYDLRVIREIVAEPGRPREVSLRTIQGLTQYILSVYQKNDYSGIYVYVPEGAIRDGARLVDGILPVNILEAPVTEVGVKFFDAERNEVEEGYLLRSAIEEWSPIERDKVASQSSLDYLVNLLNLNPDRHVSAIVSRGAEPNTLAIQYEIYETDPWHFFIQADNSGTRDRQWSPRVGVINTNLLGIDDRFTALYQAALDEIDENYSLFGSYDFPVMGPRLRLNLFGGYSEFDIDTEAGPIDFLGSGTFYGGMLRYNLFQQDKWFFDVTGSVSHEESDITPSLFPEFFASNVKMDLWGVGADLHHRDDMSTTAVTVSRVQSFGGSDQKEFWDSATSTGARTNAERDFAIYTTAANHSQYLDRDKVQQLRGTVRWISPSERLVPAKMTSFGGMYTVRGYDEYEIVADGGILASAQYEFDLVRNSEAVEQQTATNNDLRKLAPLAFFDFGRSQIEDPVAGERENQTLYSVGVGTIFEIGNNFSGAVYYGHPLKATRDTRVGKGRLNASVMLRW
ncbi:MAG: ShlB/FhaC/HecB family hemolysin secretion/activation protein [Phycisphaerales bacterium]|nr:MAG: ShlB/FhaC/HecB family hemolysin secretion/activation protein [Phycisphaerales bacterium]